jgi:hypothetical protein
MGSRQELKAGRGLRWRTPRRIAWHVLGKLSRRRGANRALDLEWDYDGPKEPQRQGADPNHSETGRQTRGAPRKPQETENRADLFQTGPAMRSIPTACCAGSFCQRLRSASSVASQNRSTAEQAINTNGTRCSFRARSGSFDAQPDALQLSLLDGTWREVWQRGRELLSSGA